MYQIWLLAVLKGATESGEVCTGFSIATEITRRDVLIDLCRLFSTGYSYGLETVYQVYATL